MRVLVTWGSKRGGTAEIADWVAQALRAEGHQVDLLPPREARRASGFDAAIVGGALYAGRWHRAARKLVDRREKDLRSVPVWFFSSGPLDDSSERDEIPPTPEVQSLMARVGALGHVTFGGRLAPDARGFPASAMAKTRAGDWRNPARIRAWAAQIARALPTARPGPVVVEPGRSTVRLIAHGVAGWAACAAMMLLLLHVSRPGVALAVHAIFAPAIFLVVARHYFRARGARSAGITALAFVTIVALLDAVVVAAAIERSFAMFASVLGTWLPFALLFAVTWATGEVMSMVSGVPRPATTAGTRVTLGTLPTARPGR